MPLAVAPPPAPPPILTLTPSLRRAPSLLTLRRPSFHHHRRHLHSRRFPCLAASSSVNGFPDHSQDRISNRGEVVGGEIGGFLGRFRAFLAAVPGGSWWSLDRLEEGIGRGIGRDGGGGKRSGLSVIEALRRMWVMVASDRLVIILAFASLAGAVLSEMSIPHYLTSAIFSAQNHDKMVFYRNVKLLVFLCFSSGICSGMRGWCFGISNMILVKRMREMLYSALLFQEASFFDNETVGDLTSRLGSDCQQVSRVISNDLNLLSRNVLQATAALIYLFVLSWHLTLSIVMICAALWTIMLVNGRYQKRIAKLIQEFTASANEVAQETFSLFRTVRVYGTEKQEHMRYVAWLDKLCEVVKRQVTAYALWTSSFNFLYHLTQALAVLVGGIFIMSGRISAEQLTKFVLYCEWLIYATWWMGDNWSSLMQSVGASEKVFELMNVLPSSQFQSKGLRLEKLKGNIDFVNVSFYYPSRKMVPVLQQLNLSVHPNEVVAIVGLSGSGKSTVVNLLLRLYEPTDGQILIDGVPLKELDIRWFRRRIGYVGQEPRLFRMDVKSNIKYGCPREVSDEDVEWAAKQAYAHDFISSLPNGYDTIVDNALLSGGQKQRIAIARAILRDPTILILDEATSALDAESEHYVKGVLRAFRNTSRTRRTVIVIAHRLSTIQAADRIVVMDSGQIVEIGSHMELLQKGGLYARLANRQADAVA